MKRTCTSCGNSVDEKDGLELTDGRFFCKPGGCQEKFLIGVYEEKVKPDLVRQNEEVLSRMESGVCDTCNGKVTSPNGYLLTTREVVSTPRYWRHYYQFHQGQMVSLGVLSYEDFCRNPLLRASVVNTMAGQRTAWMVCENCISMFGVDREKTHTYAMHWWQNKAFQPPGTGSVSIAEVNLGVAGGISHSADTGNSIAVEPARKWWEFWKK